MGQLQSSRMYLLYTYGTVQDDRLTYTLTAHPHPTPATNAYYTGRTVVDHYRCAYDTGRYLQATSLTMPTNTELILVHYTHRRRFSKDLSFFERFLVYTMVTPRTHIL